MTRTAGIATHFIKEAQLPVLYERLADLDSDEVHVVNSILEDFAGEVPSDSFTHWSCGGAIEEAINRYFLS